jgi:hypothetical protein
MKLKVGKYHSQIGFGLWYIFINGYKCIGFDFGIFYVELILKDYA